MTQTTTTRAKTLDPHLLNRSLAENAVACDLSEPRETITEALILPAGEKIETKAGDAFLLRSDKGWKHVQFIEDGTFTGPMIYTRTKAADATDLARSAPFYNEGLHCILQTISGVMAFLTTAIFLAVIVAVLICLSVDKVFPQHGAIALLGFFAVWATSLLAAHFTSVKYRFNRKSETGLTEAFYSIFGGRNVATSLPLDLLAFEGAKAAILSKSGPTSVPLHWLHEIFGKTRNGVDHAIADIDTLGDIQFLGYGESEAIKKDTAIAVQTEDGWRHVQFLRDGEIEGPMIFARQPRKSTEVLVTSSAWYSYEPSIFFALLPLCVGLFVSAAMNEFNLPVLAGSALLSVIAFFGAHPKGRFRRVAKPDLVEGIYKIHDGTEKRHQYPAALTYLLDEDASS